MRVFTRDNLRAGFAGESQAHMRYRIWGEKAKKDGFENVARLFYATADAEEVHANLHFKALKDEAGDALVPAMGGFGIGTTSENLAAAKGGEEFEYQEMYPAFLVVAKDHGEKEAIRAFEYAIAAEEVHANHFGDAKEAVDAGEDIDVDTIYLCPVCGFIGYEEIDNCPICDVKSSMFVEY